jgi:hypothetical protein
MWPPERSGHNENEIPWILGGKVGSEEGLKEQVCEQVGRSKLVEN